MEIWKNIKIKNYEHFQVSSKGRVRNSLTKNYIALGNNGKGYVNCKIKSNGITKTVYVHRLVAEAFLNNFNPDLQVNHIDKNKSNNQVENLEMVTDSENKLHSQKEYIQGHIKSQGKTLLIYDKNMNLIGEHKGLYDYCRLTNSDPRTIQRVIKGERKSYKGFIFKYQG